MWPRISPLSLLCHVQLILVTCASFFTLISVFPCLILSIVRCFRTLGDSHKEIHVYLYTPGAFSSFSVYFLPLSSAHCGQKTKSADSFILSCLCNYNMLITLTQLGLQHSLSNQASDITSCVQTTQAHCHRAADWEENNKKETRRYWTDTAWK